MSLLLNLEHPITNTGMRLNEFGRIGIWFELFAQRYHKDPKRGNIIVPASSPYVLCDISMRQYFTGIFCKKAKQFKFDRRQLQLPFV